MGAFDDIPTARAAPARGGRPRAPTATSNRRLDMAATAESMESANVTQAVGAQNLKVDRATEQAQIDKAIADARGSQLEAQMKELRAKYPQMTAEQLVMGARYNLMREGESMYTGALRRGYKPDALGNKITAAVDMIPAIGQPIATMMRSPEAQQAVLGERVFSGGALRTETGAGGPKEERPELRSRYFPTPFTAPDKTITDALAKLRQQQIETARIGSGPLGEPAAPKLPAGMTPAGARAQAKAAIAAGKPRGKIIERLRQMGVDVTGL